MSDKAPPQKKERQHGPTRKVRLPGRSGPPVKIDSTAFLEWQKANPIEAQEILDRYKPAKAKAPAKDETSKNIAKLTELSKKLESKSSPSTASTSVDLGSYFTNFQQTASLKFKSPHISIERENDGIVFNHVPSAWWFYESIKNLNATQKEDVSIALSEIKDYNCRVEDWANMVNKIGIEDTMRKNTMDGTTGRLQLINFNGFVDKLDGLKYTIQNAWCGQVMGPLAVLPGLKSIHIAPHDKAQLPLTQATTAPFKTSQLEYFAKLGDLKNQRNSTWGVVQGIELLNDDLLSLNSGSYLTTPTMDALGLLIEDSASLEDKILFLSNQLLDNAQASLEGYHQELDKIVNKSTQTNKLVSFVHVGATETGFKGGHYIGLLKDKSNLQMRPYDPFLAGGILSTPSIIPSNVELVNHIKRAQTMMNDLMHKEWNKDEFGDEKTSWDYIDFSQLGLQNDSSNCGLYLLIWYEVMVHSRDAATLLQYAKKQEFDLLRNYYIKKLYQAKQSEQEQFVMDMIISSTDNSIDSNDVSNPPGPKLLPLYEHDSFGSSSSGMDVDADLVELGTSVSTQKRIKVNNFEELGQDNDLYQIVGRISLQQESFFCTRKMLQSLQHPHVPSLEIVDVKNAATLKKMLAIRHHRVLYVRSDWTTTIRINNGLAPGPAGERVGEIIRELVSGSTICFLCGVEDGGCFIVWAQYNNKSIIPFDPSKKRGQFVLNDNLGEHPVCQYLEPIRNAITLVCGETLEMWNGGLESWPNNLPYLTDMQPSLSIQDVDQRLLCMRLIEYLLDYKVEDFVYFEQLASNKGQVKEVASQKIRLRILSDIQDSMEDEM